ncbi:bacteriocin-protection protein, partial [Leptospira adleri]
MKEFFKDIPVLHFKNGKEWENWLKKNHTNGSAIWVKFAK